MTQKDDEILLALGQIKESLDRQLDQIAAKIEISRQEAIRAVNQAIAAVEGARQQMDTQSQSQDGELRIIREGVGWIKNQWSKFSKP